MNIDAIYARQFFQCRSCGFMLTRLAQANIEVAEGCPACGENDLDYAPKGKREQYARDLLEELQAMFQEDA